MQRGRLVRGKVDTHVLSGLQQGLCKCSCQPAHSIRQEEYRNEAITVLKHNLNIRRDGLRPFMKMITSKNGLGDGSPRQPKRDLLTASPAVTIVSGRAPPQHKDYMRGNVKRTFGQW